MRITLTRLVVLVAVLTLWQLLYPFGFGEAQSSWLYETDIHKINLLGNLVLFVPLGLLLGWRLRRGGVNRALAITAVLGIGGGISLIGETLQVFLPSRQSSIVDLLANSLGVTVAGIVGYARGHRLDWWLVRLIRRLPTGAPARRLGLLTLAVFIVRTAPFHISPETRDLRLALKETYYAGWPFSDVLAALRDPGQMSLIYSALWQLGGATISVAMFALLTFTLARVLRWRYYQRRRGALPWFETVFLAGTFVVFTELLQWPIRSRVMDATDMLAGLIGVGLGLIWARYRPGLMRMDPVADAGDGTTSLTAMTGFAAATNDSTVAVSDLAVARGRADAALPPSIKVTPGATTPSPPPPLSPLPLLPPSPPLSPSSPASGAPKHAVRHGHWRHNMLWLVVVGVCCLAGIIGAVLGHLPGVPYNVAQLLGSGGQGFLRAAGLTFAVLLLGMAPGWLSRARWGAIPGLMAAAMLVAGIIIVIAPGESLQDLAGTPLLGREPGWGWLWWTELWLRLAGLVLLPLAAVLAGVAIAAPRANGRRWVLMLTAVLGLLIGRSIVITLAGTDNITELIAGAAAGGDPFIARTWIAWPGELFLGLMLLLLGINVALAATAVAMCSLRRGLIVVGLTLIAAPVGLWLFQLGTVSDLQKYGTTFSAEQFLLGANRQATLNHWEILLRWSALWLGAIVTLGVGVVLGLRLASSPGRIITDGVAGSRRSGEFTIEPSTEHRDQTSATAVHHSRSSNFIAAHRLLLFVAIPVTIFIIYGSLMPLSPPSMPLDEAMRQFAAIMTFAQQVQSNRLDWVVNFMLFGLLAVVWAATWSAISRHGTRRLSIIAMLCIGLAVVMLGMALEFAQLFLPQRITSPIDVLAQMLGAGIGLLLWRAGHHRWMRYFEAIVGVGRVGLDRLLLQIYLAGYVVYAVMPLDFILNLAELRRKAQLGQMRPWPWPQIGAWSDPVGLLWNVTGDVVLAIPIGLLLASLWPNASRPRRWRNALLVGLALLTAIEAVQILLVSRVSDVSDIVAGLIGIAVGVLLRQIDWAIVRAWPRRWVAVVAMCYAAFLVAGYTWPWSFALHRISPDQLVSHLIQMPFANLLAGSPYVALDQMLRKSLLALPLGLLLGMAFQRPRFASAYGAGRAHRGHGLYKRLTVIGIAVGTLLLIEVLQMAGDERLADPTDVIIALPGVIVGLMVAGHLRRMRTDTGESEVS